MGLGAAQEILAGRRATRRASERCRRTAAMLAVASATLAVGCGDSGRGAETDPEKGSDAAILNEALTQELTMVEAYARGMPLLRGSARRLGRTLGGQEKEYVDAITKAIRGLGGDTDAEAEDLDFAEINNQVDFLELAYELESRALAFDVDAAPRLFTDAPQTLAASLAAGHAQHLVVLRQSLGAGPAVSVPEAFDGGEVAPPSAEGNSLEG